MELTYSEESIYGSHENQTEYFMVQVSIEDDHLETIKERVFFNKYPEDALYDWISVRYFEIPSIINIEEIVEDMTNELYELRHNNIENLKQELEHKIKLNKKIFKKQIRLKKLNRIIKE